MRRLIGVNIDNIHKIHINVCDSSNSSDYRDGADVADLPDKFPYISESLYIRLPAQTLKQLLHLIFMMNLRERNLDKLFDSRDLRISLFQLITYVNGTRDPDLSFLLNMEELYIDVSGRYELGKDVTVPEYCKLHLIYDAGHRDIARKLQERIKNK